MTKYPPDKVNINANLSLSLEGSTDEKIKFLTDMIDVKANADTVPYRLSRAKLLYERGEWLNCIDDIRMVEHFQPIDGATKVIKMKATFHQSAENFRCDLQSNLSTEDLTSGLHLLISNLSQENLEALMNRTQDDDIDGKGRVKGFSVKRKRS